MAIGIAAGVIVLLTIMALVVLFRFDPRQYGFYPKCQLHSLTGLNCAGCGTLRATHHLLHGEFLLAFRSNALLILALGGMGWIGLRWLGGTPPATVLHKWFSRPTLGLVLIGIALAFSILRNLPGPAFAWMNP